MKKMSIPVLLLLLVLGCGKDADYYMEEGNAYLKRGDMAGAIGMFEKAVNADPADYEAQNALGVALSAVGDFQGAIGHFRTAVAINDSFIEGHYNLGRALAQLGSYTDALAELRRVTQLDSTYALAYLTEGDIFSSRRAGDQATDAYRTAIRFSPGLIPAYLRLSAVYMAEGEYDQAIDLLLAARTKQPRNADLVAAAGRAAMMKRDFTQAAGFLREAVQMDSTDSYIRNDFATALMLGGDREGAVSQWRKILAEHPDPDLEETVRENLERAESDSL
jgi:protein O-GlcNAc transferase